MATLLLASPLVGTAGAGQNPTGPIVATEWPYATTPQFPPGNPPAGPGVPGTIDTASSAPKAPGSGAGEGGGTREGEGSGPDSGPCPSGVGTLKQPTAPVEPGAIFTPATDGFVGEEASTPTVSRAVYHAGSGTPPGTGADGAAQFRFLGNVGEQIRVQAHFWDDWQNGPQLAMARIWIESLTGSVKYDYPFFTLGGGFGPQFKCYADDPSTGSNKFYFDWWVKVPAFMTEPGVNVRFEVLALNGASMFGADQNTLHVGPAPTAPGEQVTSALALALDDSAVVDTNGAPDDAESVLRAQLVPAVSDFLGGLNGTSVPLRKQSGEQKGSFNISEFTFAPPTLDLSLRPTSTGSTTAPGQVVEDCWSAVFGFVGECWVIFVPGGPVPSGPADDEHRLWITATLPDFDMHGNFSWSPLGADYHIGGDLSVVLSVAFDVDPVSGGLSISPDVRVEDVDVSLSDETWIDVWQWFYDLVINEDKIENTIEHLLEDPIPLILEVLGNGSPALVSAVDGAVRTAMTRVDGILAGGLGVGGGGFGLLPIQFQTTCGPLGCDGFRAGNIGLWTQGMDLVMNTGATNTGDASRFPKTYDPETPDTADVVHSRTTPAGQPFDVGLWADAALVNQILTSVGASGVLDVTGGLGSVPVSVRGEVAPVLVPTEQLGLGSPDDKPLTILWPNVQVDLGGPLFAVDVAIGVDAAVDEMTGHLVPSAAVGINIRLLRCPGLELICGFLANPDLQDQFEQWLGQNVIQPLLASSIGQVAIPQALGMRVGAGSVASVDGNLAAFADIAAIPQLKLAITPKFHQGLHAPLDEVKLKATPLYYPGSGPYQVNWNVQDGDGNVVYQSPPGGESALDKTFDADEFFQVDDGELVTMDVHAEVTVTRGGWTLEETDQDHYWWFSPIGPCPPQC